MRVLVLDDEQYRHDAFARRFTGHEVVHAHTADEALSALSGLRFDVAQLDHDLGPGPTGMVVADAIARMDPGARPGIVRVHSWNPPAAARMVALLRDFGAAAALEPFHWPDPIFDEEAP